jgi:cytochrome c-type biogenesis protein
VLTVNGIGVLAAFGAGLLSFLSPCVFPLVPGYLAYIAGTTTREAGSANIALRWRVTMHAACFVAGFSLIFVILGASASTLGQIFAHHHDVLTKVAGAVIIVFGLHIAGVFKIPWLYREVRREVALGSGGPAYLRSGLIGLAFGAGWTPCVGPLLGSILTLAAATTTLRGGVVLLLVYSLGLGMPFLATGLLMGSASRGFRSLNRLMQPLGVLSGVLMVAMGVLVLSGLLARLALYAPLVALP